MVDPNAPYQIDLLPLFRALDDPDGWIPYATFVTLGQARAYWDYCTTNGHYTSRWRLTYQDRVLLTKDMLHAAR